MASDGKTLISKNGLRRYGPPALKVNSGKTQANLETFRPGFRKPFQIIIRYKIMITGQVKEIYSAEGEVLETYVFESNEPFCVFVRVSVGIFGKEGADSFDIKVCNTRWIDQQIEQDGFFLGAFSLVLADYNPALIRKLIIKFFERYSGDSWNEIGMKLSRIARWEFEDYQ